MTASSVWGYQSFPSVYHPKYRLQSSDWLIVGSPTPVVQYTAEQIRGVIAPEIQISGTRLLLGIQWRCLHQHTVLMLIGSIYQQDVTSQLAGLPTRESSKVPRVHIQAPGLLRVNWFGLINLFGNAPLARHYVMCNGS